MTCLSDIDLATLHKSRLEERLNYKLAWGGATTNRLSAYQQHHHHTVQQQHARMNSFQASPKATARPRNAAQKQKQQQKSTKTQQQQQSVNQQQQQTQHMLDNDLSSMTRSSPQRNAPKSSTCVTDDLLNGNCVELGDKLQHLNLHFDDDSVNNGHPKVQHKSRKSCAGNGRSSSSRLLNDDPNCNYFTATTRRRRSGTWP